MFVPGDILKHFADLASVWMSFVFILMEKLKKKKEGKDKFTLKNIHTD